MANPPDRDPATFDLRSLLAEGRFEEARAFAEQKLAAGHHHPAFVALVADMRAGKRPVERTKRVTFYAGTRYEMTLEGPEFAMEAPRRRGRATHLNLSYGLEVWCAFLEYRRAALTWEQALDRLVDRSGEFGGLGREAIRDRLKAWSRVWTAVSTAKD